MRLAIWIMSLLLFPLIGNLGTASAMEGGLYLEITPHDHKADVRVRMYMSNSEPTPYALSGRALSANTRSPLEYAEERSFLQVRHPSPCTELTYIFYRSSKHPGPNPELRFNQENEGFGARCFLDKGKNFFILGAGLLNSQYGNTAAFGPGFRLSTPELRLMKQFGLSVNAGAEAPVISYEWPRRKKTILGVLPMPFIGANLHLPYGLGVIGYNRNYLPEGIKLNYITWTTSFQINMF